VEEIIKTVKSRIASAIIDICKRSCQFHSICVSSLIAR
jgi:hypothetical protein